MHPTSHQLREKLGSDEPILGTFLVELASPVVVHALADGDFDFVMIDCEHGNYTERQVERLIEAAWHAGVCAIVRVANHDRALITRALDAGAGGILAPAIDSLEQVHQIVRASKYRPVGKRGVHLMRGHTRHQGVDANRFMAQANADILTIIQIELAEAVELIDDIAATDGVDGLYVGPGDLSVDLGLAGQWESQPVTDAIKQVVLACQRHGKIAGCHADNIADMPRLLELGVGMFGYYCDIGMFCNTATSAARQFRQTLGSAVSYENR